MSTSSRTGFRWSHSIVCTSSNSLDGAQEQHELIQLAAQSLSHSQCYKDVCQPSLEGVTMVHVQGRTEVRRFRCQQFHQYSSIVILSCHCRSQYIAFNKDHTCLPLVGSYLHCCERRLWPPRLHQQHHGQEQQNSLLLCTKHGRHTAGVHKIWNCVVRDADCWKQNNNWEFCALRILVRTTLVLCVCRYDRRTLSLA